MRNIINNTIHVQRDYPVIVSEIISRTHLDSES